MSQPVVFLDQPFAHPVRYLRLFLGVAGFVSGFLFFWNLSAFPLWLKCQGISYGALSWMSFLQWPYVFKPLYVLWMPHSSSAVQRQVGLCVLTCAGVSGLLATSWFSTCTPCVLGAMLVFCTASAYLDCLLDCLKLHASQEGQNAAIFSANQLGFQVGLWLTGWVIWRFSEVWGWYVIFQSLSGILLTIAMLCVLFAFPCTLDSIPQNLSCRKPNIRIWTLVSFLAVYKCFDVGIQGISDFFWIDQGYTLSQIADTSKGCGVFVSIITSSFLIFLGQRFRILFLPFFCLYLLGAAGLFGLWSLQGNQTPALSFLWMCVGFKSILVSLGLFLSQWGLALHSGQNHKLYILGTSIQTFFRVLHSFWLIQWTHVFSWQSLYQMLFWSTVATFICMIFLIKRAQEDLNPQPLDP